MTQAPTRSSSTRARKRTVPTGAPNDRAPIDGAPIGPDTHDGPPGGHYRRFVIVVRADPVICGHSSEARNLAEAALTRGFEDVRILTWPLERLEEVGLPLKPLDSILPYSDGITVERPEPVGDYRVPDGRYLTGLQGRLFELFADGVPTVVMSMYLLPHANAVMGALEAVRATGLRHDVVTIAEAVGSDITNVVRSCLSKGRVGAAAHLFATYLAHDRCVAVSEFTRDLIIDAAGQVDAALGTNFALQCSSRVRVSYPAVNAAAYTALDDGAVDVALDRRGLTRDGYVLFLSRLTAAKGVDDLIEAYRMSHAADQMKLVIGGTGPALPELREQVGDDDRIVFLTDIDDIEKPLLMAGCAVYALPSKPRPEFIETFGLALVEQMLTGGGPVVTTSTGGIPEAVGDAAIHMEAGDARSIASAIDHAVIGMSPDERSTLADRALAHAGTFDKAVVFDRLFQDLFAVAG